MFWQPIYDLRWEIMNVCIVHDIISENSTLIIVVALNPSMGIDRQHESREARSLYPLALQLARALRLEFVGRAI
jgi:hypothetical protein